MRSKPGPALHYHQAVSYDRDRMDTYSLDWAVQPKTGKAYPGYPRIGLEGRIGFPSVSLSRALSPADSSAKPRLSGERLSRILFSAYGATSAARHSGGKFHYRTAPSAGALYPTELYLALAAEEAAECGLDPGLYHYPAPEHGLTLLRGDDFGLEESLFLLTAITFRSAWKYRARAFRYCGLDTGHVAENLLLALKAEGYAPAILEALPGAGADAFLGLDPDREWSLTAVSLKGRATPDSLPPAQDRALAEYSRVSAGEKAYKELEGILDRLRQPFRPLEEAGEGADMGLCPGPWQALPQPPEPEGEASLGRCLSLRCSKRNFVRSPLAAAHLGGLARMMTLETDLPFSVGLLLGGAEGISGGFYLLDREARNLALVRPGDLRREMAGACLDQAWLAQSAVHFVFLADLARLDRAGGARAYKEALILAGRLGQRIYLGAAGLGLGCCGVGAFYDEECRELLGLDPDSRLLYLVAAGPVKR